MAPRRGSREGIKGSEGQRRPDLLRRLRILRETPHLAGSKCLSLCVPLSRTQSVCPFVCLCRGLTEYRKPASLLCVKVTIDIPDELYRRVKSRSAEQGRRIREVADELFRRWVEGVATPVAQEAIPMVTPSQLSCHRDASSLRAAYPRGYRLAGPLLPAGQGGRPIAAGVVERALADMDEEELAVRGCSR